MSNDITSFFLSLFFALIFIYSSSSVLSRFEKMMEEKRPVPFSFCLSSYIGLKDRKSRAVFSPNMRYIPPQLPHRVSFQILQSGKKEWRKEMRFCSLLVSQLSCVSGIRGGKSPYDMCSCCCWRVYSWRMKVVSWW